MDLASLSQELEKKSSVETRCSRIGWYKGSLAIRTCHWNQCPSGSITRFAKGCPYKR
jgi:hypothetical protein